VVEQTKTVWTWHLPYN